MQKKSRIIIVNQTTKETMRPAQMYCNYVKFHQYRSISLGGVVLTINIDRRTDRVIPIYPPKTLFAGCIIITVTLPYYTIILLTLCSPPPAITVLPDIS